MAFNTTNSPRFYSSSNPSQPNHSSLLRTTKVWYLTQWQNNCLLTKFSLLSLPSHPSPHWFLAEGHHVRILKQIHVSFSQVLICLSRNWCFGLLLIGPLIYPHLILQNVHNFRGRDGLAFCSPGSQAGTFGIDFCRANLLLSHRYTVTAAILLQQHAKIKLMKCHPGDISLPWTNAPY